MANKVYDQHMPQYSYRIAENHSFVIHIGSGISLKQKILKYVLHCFTYMVEYIYTHKKHQKA